MASPNRVYTFDAVYGPSSSQRDIYVGTVAPILEEVLEGYNCTIFCYGQTGTGKTYTMEGPSIKASDNPASIENKWKSNHQAGIITRSVSDIFSRLNKTRSEYTVKVSHLELYNEELIDLLNLDNKSLKLFEDPHATSSDSVTVHGLTEVTVFTPQEIFDIVAKSSLVRRTAETNLNRSSSRSHCIFAVTIYIKEHINGEEVLKMGKLNLVDLAGSENVSRSGVRSNGKSEAGMINKSLLTLGRVITALVEKSRHIPYRDSKLTRLLQDSLGGRTKTCIIATISPSSPCLDETINTLEYAHRAKNICNQPQLNKTQSKQEVMTEYTVEIEDLRAQVVAMRQKSGIFIPIDEFDKMQTESELTADKIAALEEYIVFKEKELEEIKEMFDKHASSLTIVKENLSSTQGEYDARAQTLQDTQNVLATTQDGLVQQRVLLDAHIRAEQEFQTASADITTLLASSLKDVKGLHQRIDRVSHLQESNARSFGEVQCRVVQAVAGAESAVQQFVAGQERQMGLLVGHIDRFLGQKQVEIDAVSEKVARLEHLLAEKYRQLQRLSELEQARALQVQQRTEQLQQQQHQALEREQKAVTTCNQKHTQNIVGGSFAKHQLRSATWTEARCEELSGLALAAQQTRDKNALRMQETRQMVHAKMDETEVQSKHNQSLTEFTRKQREDLEGFKGSLLSRMGGLVSQFTAQQDQKSREDCKSMGVVWETDLKKISDVRKSLCESLDDSADRHAAFNASLASTYTALQAKMRVKHQAAQDHCQHATRALHAIAHTDDEALARALTAHAHHTARRLDTHASTLARWARDTQATLTLQQQACQACEGATKGLAKALTDFGQDLKQHATTWTEETESQCNVMLSSAKNTTETTETFLQSLRDLKLKEYEVTGETPAKKKVSYLPKIDQTRDDAIIIAQYWNHGEPIPEFEAVQSNEMIVEEVVTEPPVAVQEPEPEPLQFVALPIAPTLPPSNTHKANPQKATAPQSTARKPSIPQPLKASNALQQNPSLMRAQSQKPLTSLSSNSTANSNLVNRAVSSNRIDSKTVQPAPPRTVKSVDEKTKGISTITNTQKENTKNGVRGASTLGALADINKGALKKQKIEPNGTGLARTASKMTK